MPAPYMDEVSKVIESPHIMHWIKGRVADIGCGGRKVTDDAVGFDGRDLGTPDIVQHDLFLEIGHGMFDTIFSSHFLEHVPNPYEYILNWSSHLNPGGFLVLYLPEATAYDNYKNPEHCFNWRYEDFLFWFRRCFCGEGKDYKGNHFPAIFELIHNGLDVIGPERYSFFIAAVKL